MMLLLALIALASAAVAEPAAHKLIITPMGNVSMPSALSKFECNVCLNFVYASQSHRERPRTPSDVRARAGPTRSRS